MSLLSSLRFSSLWTLLTTSLLFCACSSPPPPPPPPSDSSFFSFLLSLLALIPWWGWIVGFIILIIILDDNTVSEEQQNEVFKVDFNPKSQFVIGLVGPPSTGKTSFVASAICYSDEYIIDPRGDGGLYASDNLSANAFKIESTQSTRSWYEENIHRALVEGKYPQATHVGEWARWRIRCNSVVGEIRDYPGKFAVDDNQDRNTIEILFQDVDVVFALIPIDRTPFFFEAIQTSTNPHAQAYWNRHRYHLRSEYGTLKADLTNTIEIIQNKNPNALIHFVITKTDFAEALLERRIDKFDVYKSLYGLNQAHSCNFDLSTSFIVDLDTHADGHILYKDKVPQYTLPSTLIGRLSKQALDLQKDQVLLTTKLKNKVIKEVFKLIIDAAL